MLQFQSKLLAPTLKEVPSDAEVASHRLMLRAGMIRKVAAGIYTYMPLGWRVINKVATIVREEMDRAGAQEILMPAVIPSHLWKESGRWDEYGPELLRLVDRKGSDFCVGPTHEEVVTTLVRDNVQSYKSLPLNLYQVQTKFRDEVRPRFGLMRGREFIMKDAYSFDLDEEAATKSYEKMFAAYQRIFQRCGLDFKPVEADTGAIGGKRSHEFQVMAETGEDTIVVCDDCGYAANVELAEIAAPRVDDNASQVMGSRAYEEVYTGEATSCIEVADRLGVATRRVLKSMLFIANAGEDDSFVVMALTFGDEDVNEIKLRKAVDARAIRLASDDEVLKLGLTPGVIGPVLCPEGIRVVADQSLQGARDLICGANRKEAHFAHVHVSEHFVAEFKDLRAARAGDACGRCGGTLSEKRGIEVGHVFFLGNKYSKAMNVTVLDPNGKAKELVMGCYGIGVGRTAAAAIEQHHDDFGISWPWNIAPYQVHVLAIGKDEEVLNEAQRIAETLEKEGYDILLDDRGERPGVKFKDADLIGCPLRISVGSRGLKEGKVEVKTRRMTKDEAMDVNLDAIVANVNKLANTLRP